MWRPLSFIDVFFDIFAYPQYDGIIP